VCPLHLRVSNIVFPKVCVVLSGICQRRSILDYVSGSK
jgi:hypothetical protein